MANIYASAKNCSSSSPPAEPDDISLFLQEFLLRSSSSSSSWSLSSFPSNLMQQQSFATTHNHVQASFQGSVRISLPETYSGLNSFSGRCFPTMAGANASSSSVGTVDNDPDGYDCESEEAIEVLMEDELPEPTPPRNSSKRRRAAEVHNLSEKRRRSRINEKMKALQNLIPNSNKTDKASMLDEAIEYLKQLQLQVQMLTMRNGLSFYPMSLPEVPYSDQISQMRIGVYPGSGSLNMASEPPPNQDNLSNVLFCQSDDIATQAAAAAAANFSTMISPKTSTELASLQAHLGTFQLSRSSQGTRRDEEMLFQQVNRDFLGTSLRTVSSSSFDAQPSKFNNNALHTCFAGGQQLECAHGSHSNLSPQLNSTGIGLRASHDNIKIERNNLRFHQQL